MEKFLTLVVSGGVSGTIYSLIAAGLVLSYSSTGIFNLAYGGVAFTCALVYYELNVGLGWPSVVAAGFTVCVFAPLLGLVLDRAVFRPLARTSDAAKLMATVGLALALPALARWTIEILIDVFDFSIPRGDQVYIPPGIGPSPKEQWELPGGVAFDSNQLIVVVAAACSALALWVLMRRTQTGLQMRALVDRPALAELRSVDPRRTSAVSWVLGTVLAGLAGVAGAPVLGSLQPSTWTSAVFIATTAAVLGRLRSVPLAFVGGMVLGAGQNLVAGYVNIADDIQGFSSSVPFLFLLVGLAVLGVDRSRATGTVAEEVPPPDYLQDLPQWRRRAPWLAATVVLLVYMLIADDFWIALVGRGLIVAIIFLSFTVLTGIGGMVSLAQAAFVSIAGLVAGRVIEEYGLPSAGALVVGVLAAVAVGLLAALPALRLGGVPLTLATLALAFVCDSVLFQWDWLSGGREGWTISRPELGPLDLDNDRTLAWCALLVTLLVVVLVRNLQRSATGRAMIAVRSAPAAAVTSGVSPVLIKLALFSLSAAIAGFGGVLLATYNESVTSSSTPAALGLIWLANVVLFGVRRPGGAVVAGLVSVLFPQVLSSGVHWPWFVPEALDWDGTRSIWVPSILFGMGAIQLSRNPDGVLSMMAMQNHARRAARRARLEAREPGSEVGTAEPLVAAPGRAPVGAATPGPEPRVARLRVREVTAGYGDVVVLTDVDLELVDGRLTVLLGANGAGKSTLCQTIAGMIAVRKGAVLLDGTDVSSWPAHRRSRQGIVLAPESRGVFPGLSVDDNLALWLRDPVDRERVFDRFPILRERRHAAAGFLSGGEQQMLALAPVLARPPAVLVVDEPTLGLAPTICREVVGWCAELARDGCAVLLVEEKAGDVLGVADDIAFLELGRISWAGQRDAVDDARLTAAYLGVASSAARPATDAGTGRT